MSNDFLGAIFSAVGSTLLAIISCFEAPVHCQRFTARVAPLPPRCSFQGPGLVVAKTKGGAVVGG